MKEAADANANPKLNFICADIDGNRYGELTISDTIISVQLNSFDGSYPVIASNRLVLSLDNAQCVTLLEAFDESSGSNRYGENLVYTSIIQAHMALIGPSPWEEDDKIYSFSFTFYGAKSALYYRDYQKSEFKKGDGDDIGSDSFINLHTIDHGKLDILELKHEDDITIKISISLSGGLNIYDKMQGHTPRIFVESPNGVSIKYALHLASDVLSFFELSMGHKSRLLDFEVCTLTSDRLSEVREDRGITTIPRYSLRTLKGDWRPPIGIHFADVIFNVYDPHQREQTRHALQAWLDRRFEWKTAYWLSSRYLEGAKSIDRSSAVRLLAWFEAIPNRASCSEVTDATLAKLRRAIRKLPEFTELRISPDRLSEVLVELKRFSVKQRISSSISSLSSKLNMAEIPVSLEKDCHKLVRYRNLAAHGGAQDDDVKLEDILTHMEAVELLCLLSSISGLVPAGWKPMRGWHKLKSYMLRSR